MSMNPVLGAALHLLQYLSRAALVKASAYSRTLPVFMLDLYRRSAQEDSKYFTNQVIETRKRGQTEEWTSEVDYFPFPKPLVYSTY